MGMSKRLKAQIWIMLLAFSLLNAAICINSFVMPVKASSYSGPPDPSLFKFSRNTTYNYNFTYSIERTVLGSSQYERWLAVLDNRTFLDPSGSVYQQEFNVTGEAFDSVLEEHDITDEHGNAVRYFRFSLAQGATWKFSLEGNYTLRQVSWKNNDTLSYSDYNLVDPLYVRYTQEEEMVNKSHPQIQARVDQLNSSNPIQTAINVYNFVANYLDYEIQPDEYGAEYAIENGEGDCTEYAFLMVALLRACGIPARPLRGLVIAESSQQGVSPNFDAAVGTSMIFASRYEGLTLASSNITGHAWLEYFVPGYGWIITDPTWHVTGDYNNAIDTIHVPETSGTWIGAGITPSFGSPVPFFPIHVSGGCTQEYRYRFTVVAQEAPPTIWEQLGTFIMENPGIFIAIVSLVVSIVAVIFIIKARRRKTYSKSSGNDRQRIF
ncbi:hypothetical protein GF325_08315, partial [Candidatus Bathyarchaeota archaeon]|nr:hypothetical protein [Candidatus Bathyarchaeota archaeon]